MVTIVVACRRVLLSRVNEQQASHSHQQRVMQRVECCVWAYIHYYSKQRTKEVVKQAENKNPQRG